MIDDVQRALSLMSELGRRVVTGPAENVRTAVLEYATRRQWTVIPYAAFDAWTRQLLENDAGYWWILDPLSTRAGLDGRANSVRLTRRFVGHAHAVVEANDGGELMPADKVGVVDDAASSGRTLRHAADMLARRGASLARVVVCASSRIARDSLGSVPWLQFVAGDWRVIHLRDGCPFLPCAGRSTDRVAADQGGRPIELRVPMSTVTGNLWQVLMLDRGIADAAQAARLAIPKRLSEALHRPACVRDVALLGASVSVDVAPNEAAAGATLLRDLA